MNAADRTFAPSDKNIKISDSATSISDNIDNLIANKDKIKTIDSSDDKPISLTAQQLNALKGKFGGRDAKGERSDGWRKTRHERRKIYLLV